MSLPPEPAPDADDRIAEVPLSPYHAASATGSSADANPGTFHGPPVPPSLDGERVPVQPAGPDESTLDAYQPFGTTPWPTVTTPVGPAPATLGRRSGAFILDLFLTFLAILLVIFLGLGGTFGLFANGVFGIYQTPWIAIALNTAGVWLFGSTLGQRMLGLRVVDPESGARIGLARTLLRTAIIVSPMILLAAATYLPVLDYVGYYSNSASLFWLAPLVWLIMLVVAGASGRSLHDRAARSIVVRVR